MNVVDLVSPSLPALLRTLDGYKTKDAQRPFTLHLADAQVDHVSPGFFTKLLNTLIDPNLIPLLFLAGIAGIGFEIFHPGVVLPGALGGIALLTALFGLSVLPIGWSGVALVLLGILLLVLDLHVPSHGALTLTGLIALGVGLVMLFHNAPAPYRVSVPFVFALTAVIGGTWAFAIGKAIALRRRPAIVGPSEIVGEYGVVRGDGKVFVHGELWRARTPDDERLRVGDEVEVAALDGDGLVLTVRPLDREAAH
jgi:membrane-bound serine protease (ClpP class)